MDSFLGLYLDLCLDLCLGSLLVGHGFNSLHMPGGIICPRQRKEWVCARSVLVRFVRNTHKKKEEKDQEHSIPRCYIDWKDLFLQLFHKYWGYRGGPRGISMCIILVYPIRTLVNNGIPYLTPVIKQIINCKINVHSHYYYHNIHFSFRQLVLNTFCTTLNISKTLHLLIVNAHRTTPTTTKPYKKH